MILADTPEAAIAAQEAGVDRIFYDLEYVGKAVTGADGDNAQGLLGSGDLGGLLVLGHDLLGVLQAHVLDLDGDEGAVVDGLVQCLAGVVGVDMDLDDLLVVHQHQAVAQGVQEGPEGLHIHVVLPLDDELGAVGEGDVVGVEVGEVGGVLGLTLGSGGGDGQILALQSQSHGLQSQQPALAAGIDHAGLLQDGVHVGGGGQSDLRLGDGGVMDELDVVVLPGGLGGLGGSQTGDGENGALGGLHDGLVGGVHAALERLSPHNAVGLGLALQGVGDAPHQQGQDDAGVASCAPQHGGGSGLGGLLQGGVLHLAQVCGGGVDGHGHVGAGVAIGHGEHVQVVELLLVDFNGCGGADDHSAKIGAVDNLFQIFLPPK